MILYDILTADRQTGRQADRQTGRQADRQTGRISLSFFAV